jgi:hypothetical protein
VQGVVFSPNGQTLAAASEDGTIQLWPQAFFFLPAELYRRAQLDTGRRVEGVEEQELDDEAWQALKQKTAD